MRPFLHHAAVVEDQDVIRMHYGRDAMGDDHASPAGEERAQIPKDQLLLLGIDRRQGIIEDEDLRL